MGLELFKETMGKKDDGAVEFKNEMNTELKHAERKTCNESYDIRDTGIKGNPFVSSAQGILSRELRASEKPQVMTDKDLHSDTTRPGDNDVTSMKGDYARSFSDSGEWLVEQQKGKKVPDAVKRKVMNS